MDHRNAQKTEVARQRASVKPGEATEAPARSQGEELINAVLDGDAARLKQLLDDGARPGYADKDGNTPLILACEGEAECVKLLLTADSPLEHRNQAGTSALMAAIIYEDIQIVKFLFLAGVEPTDDAVELAKESGVPEIIEEVTGECTPERKIDRESYRKQRVDTEIRVKSSAGKDVESFTHGFVIANADKLEEVRLSAIGEELPSGGG